MKRYKEALAIVFLIIGVGCHTSPRPNHVAVFPISKLSYDVEIKPKTASWPFPDSIVTVQKGDTLRITWAHSVEKATAQDSLKQYDRFGGWTIIAQGIEDLTGGVVAYNTSVNLEPGSWTLRIWAFYHEGPGKWNPSPAPSDEIELLVVDKPVGAPAPRPPMLIDIKIK